MRYRSRVTGTNDSKRASGVAAQPARKRLALGTLRPWQANGACVKSASSGSSRSAKQSSFPGLAGMADPPFEAGFCFMGAGVAASRKWSRARSGFRAPRERCSICRCPQVCGSVIREKRCLIATRRAVAVAVSGRKLFFRPTRSKGTRALFNARTEGGLFCDSGRWRIGPP